MSAPSGMSKYALKIELRELMHAAYVDDGIKAGEINKAYWRWTGLQMKQVGRSLPQGHTEELACKIIWLKHYIQVRRMQCTKVDDRVAAN
jgi:hypothetical protein